MFLTYVGDDGFDSVWYTECPETDFMLYFSASPSKRQEINLNKNTDSSVHTFHLLTTIWWFVGPVSVVGIATGYGLNGPGIESPWGKEFPHLSRPALGPT